jgi:hypothetical protein
MAALVGALAGTFVITRYPAAPERAEIVLDAYFRDLKTVSELVGGQPARLLVDTGGGATLVTPDFAVRLGCKPQGTDIGRRMNGDAVSFRRCPAQLLQAGSFRASIGPLAVFDVNALLPKELPRLDGVLALDAFAGRVARIEWGAGRIVVAVKEAGERCSMPFECRALACTKAPGQDTGTCADPCPAVSGRTVRH